ncbi:MAG: sigma-70 family RNA polymerase sigma factor [Verrucomicrobia bacterium]|nr:sigma-70 family RNA polymerase sigma factor [Verrucomicrobiota bacterium]
MTDDPTLLRRYAAERAEDAFAEFVRRHLPLVYSAALRRLGGDAHRAEDVAQVVFCAVARDAHRLSRHTKLTGWLYTATRYAVVDAIRAESRRRVREEEAHFLQEVSTDPAATADWSRLRPVLDAAMDELSDDDREAVLLRFFEGRPFAEIGLALGLSEDTARKRVERALEKLRGQLGRRQIASTAAALAALLAAETVAAAPAGLAASVTGAALAGGGAASAAAVGATTFLTLTKLQAGLAAAVIIGGVVGLVTQQRTISALRENAAATERPVAKLSAENVRPAEAPVTTEAEAARPRGNVAASEPASPDPRRPGESARVASRAPDRAATELRPLPDTPEIQQQRSRMHRRYDPFFQARGLTTAEGDRFVDLKIQQAIAREDLQASVRTANLPGDTAGIEAMRAKLYAPITQGLYDLLGEGGYRAYAEYEKSSALRMSYVEPLLPGFGMAGAPLTSAQTEGLVAVFAANSRSVRANPTDIGTTGVMDWAGALAGARAVLTPEQLTVLQAHVERRMTTPPAPKTAAASP